MTIGAKDWTNAVTILAVYPDGTVEPVKVNAAGRLEAVLVGAIDGITDNITVEQDDAIREIQGVDGVDLHTIAVDSSGRIIMVVYGTATIEGTATVTQDSAVREIQGADGVTLRTMAVDGAGRAIMVPIGQSGNYLLIDAEGRMSAVLVGTDGATLRPVVVNDAGNLVAIVQGMDGATPRPIAVDASGRIIMLPYGTTTVDGTITANQAAVERTMQGIEGETLRTLLVDSSGRIIMVPYGTTTVEGTATVTQDSAIRTVQGIEGANLRTLTVDSSGRLIMVPIGQSGYYMSVDASGNLTVILKGIDGETLRTVAVDSAGKLLAVLQGDYEGTLKTVALDADGRMETVVKGTKDVTRGLRLWYKFNSKEGTNIRDSSPWGNDGVIYDGATPTPLYADGLIGQGIILDGANDKVEIPTSETFNFGTESFSIECWVKPISIDTAEGFIDHGTGGSRMWYLIGWAGNYFRFYTIADEGSVNVNHSATLGSWQHVVCVVDRENDLTLIYVDTDVASTSIAGKGPFDDTDAPVTLGYNTPNSAYSNCYMDEVRIYGVALTADEVAIRYNLTKPGGTGSLQEIAVNTRGQIEVQARDANALIRNLLVDSAGRLIVVPRGESGYYLNVDANGYMGAILKAEAAVSIAANVTVEQDDATRTVQGIEGANLRTLAVDSSGRLIAIMRGAAGYNVLVDSNGYLTSAMKGYDGSVYRTIKTDTSGRMEALMKGTYDATLKTIATDSDGKMLATIRNMPYENVLIAHHEQMITSGNNATCSIGPVPAGKLWVITSILTFVTVNPVDRIGVYIYAGGSTFYIHDDRQTAAIFRHTMQGQWFLDAGDSIRAIFENGSGAGGCQLYINGYILPMYS